VQEQAEAVLGVSAEQGLTFWAAYGAVMLGWALVMQGQGAEGIVQLHQGVAAWRATGAALGQTYFLALLAEAYGQVGQTEAGLSVLAEALVAASCTGEQFYAAELHRLKGEVLRAQADKEHTFCEAEVCFRQALAVARRQQAKSLELRAAMSLSRLWQQQGKGDAARHLLAGIYHWFTEGFDSADLQEAKALLAAMS
jgi:predicted ATPase